MAINDSDLFLINRDNTTYKLTGEKLIEFTSDIPGDLTVGGSATFAGEVLAGTRARFNTDGARDNAQSVIDIYDQDGQGVNPSTVRINANGSAEFGTSSTGVSLGPHDVGTTSERGRLEIKAPSGIAPGAASFAISEGSTQVIRFNTGGSATFAGQLTVNNTFNTYRATATGDDALFKINSDVGGTNQRQVTIRANGTITAKGYSMASLAQL